jgi:hypothetical protein
MGFSINNSNVEVNIFRATGSWYTTLELRWDRFSSEKDDTIELIHETFRRCLREQYPEFCCDTIAVCLEPYHEYSHPILIEFKGKK